MQTVDLSWGEIDPKKVPRTTSDHLLIPAIIASDRQGMFGHECQQCQGYWRSRAAPSRWAMTCPYCGHKALTQDFLTQGQRRFVKRCCEQVFEALQQEADQTIDMDAISDEIARGGEPPAFYYAEQSQQCHFSCAACGVASDVLGKYVYCCCCGYRNNLQLVNAELDALQDRANSAADSAELVILAISQLDSAGRDFLRQIAIRVPMTKRRRKSVEDIRFFNINFTNECLERFLDISLLHGFSLAEGNFMRMMLERRHLFTHNAGVVDERYLQHFGDGSVRIGQALRETTDNVGRLIELIRRAMGTLDSGFHEIFPPDQTALKLLRRP